MWEKAVNIFRTAEAFLRTDKAPPGTSPEYLEEAKKTTFLASKKFFIVFCAFLMLALFYGSSIVVLFMTAPWPTITTAFVTICVKSMEILMVIVASFLGVETVVNCVQNSGTNVDYSAQNQNINQNINQTIETIEKKIIMQGEDGAPEIRPFSSLATEEDEDEQ